MCLSFDTAPLPGWDGVDRVTPLLLRVSDNEIWLRGGHCWLRAMLSQWSGEERLHANVLTPVLISGKQGLSKSTLFDFSKLYLA